MAIRALFLLLALTVLNSKYVFAENSLNESIVGNGSQKQANKFTELSIRMIKDDSESACHKLSTQDEHWQKTTFDQLPQSEHFCIRAWINIDKPLLTANPSLLVGLLGASSFYWDGALISRNGVVGDSSRTEIPGVIKTLVRIPEQNLITGRHLLSADISTFHVGKKLDSIGYLLLLVDEQNLHHTILILTILSAAFIGASIILAVIFQLNYWLYQQQISYQIFSLFCLTSALLLTAEQAKFWFDYTYNWHIYRISLIYSLTLIASFLLPYFYIQHYPIPLKKISLSVILISLLILSTLNSSYDKTSTLLFFGALIWALIINLYSLFRHNKGKINVVIIGLSLFFLTLIPDYFSEFGFSIVFVFVVMTMLISLIKEMHVNKLKALKAERIKTELLRRNMQPHFLMNCLTQLMELIEIKPKDAINFIAVLSDEFRQLTTQSDKRKVLLSDEISLCNKHLNIMSFRYQQTYHLAVEGEVKDILIPPSILHSQIENCFTHNEISSSRPFILIIKKQNGRVNLLLKTPIEKRINHKGTGLGEKYIKAKLAEIDQTKNIGTKAQKSEFESYEAHHYWMSKYSFDA